MAGGIPNDDRVKVGADEAKAEGLKTAPYSRARLRLFESARKAVDMLQSNSPLADPNGLKDELTDCAKTLMFIHGMTHEGILEILNEGRAVKVDLKTFAWWLR